MSASGRFDPVQWVFIYAVGSGYGDGEQTGEQAARLRPHHQQPCGLQPIIQHPPGASQAFHSVLQQMNSEITIYHNPHCGTSRNTLALIRNSGAEPRVVFYLDAPPSRCELARLIADMGISVRELLRQKGSPHDELDLSNSKWSDDQLLDFMMLHPILINRPIVKTPLGTRLCRPSELVLELLVTRQQGQFAKENGEIVIDESGRRVGSSSP